ncbi:MAG TPA: hypothetical protein VIM42_09955, partial [Clostridium sp.]
MLGSSTFKFFYFSNGHIWTGVNFSKCHICSKTNCIYNLFTSPGGFYERSEFATVVAAESLGIGSCYIGDIIENCETIRDVLDLPDYVIPAAMLIYGYPVEAQKSRKKPVRFEEQYIVYENKYRRLNKEEHIEMQ